MKKFNFTLVLLFVLIVARVQGVGIAYTDFLCPQNPLIMYEGEERDVSLWLQNSNEEDARVRVKMIEGAGVATFNERDYTVKAKTEDTEVKVSLRIPEDVALGTKYDITLNFLNLPFDGSGGISLTTAMDVKICVQVGEYVPQLSPDKGYGYWIVGVIIAVLAVLIAVFLIKRNKKIINNA